MFLIYYLGLFNDSFLTADIISVYCVTGIPELLSSSPTLGNKETQHTQKKGIKMRDSN